MLKRKIARGIFLAGTLVVAIALVGTSLRLTIYKPKPFVIAVAGGFQPESGNKARDIVRGAQLIADSLNDKGGVRGRKVEIRPFNDANDPARARAVAEEIAATDDVLAVIGHTTSACSIAAGEIYKREGVPAITVTATATSLTTDNPWYFRVISTNRFQGQFLATYSSEIFKDRQVSIIYEEDVYGAELARIYADTARELGMQVVNEWSFDPGATNPNRTLREIAYAAAGQGADAGLIFLAVKVPEGVKLVKLLRDLGVENRLLGGDALANIGFAREFERYPREQRFPGHYTDGMYVCTPMLFDQATRVSMNFEELYESIYETQPFWHAAYGHDATLTIAKAMREGRLGAPRATVADERKRLRAHLANIDSKDEAVEGVGGPIQFDAQGDVNRPFAIGVYHNRAIVSSVTQLHAIPNYRNVTDMESIFDPARVVEVGGEPMYQTSIVYAGLEPILYEEVNMARKTFYAEFYLWFRFEEGLRVEDIEFLNAEEPIELGMPVDQKRVDGMSYQVFHVKGTFKADTIPIDYGTHFLGVSFRHQTLSSHNLIYVFDHLGMWLAESRNPLERMRGDVNLLDPVSGWTIARGVFYRDIVEEHSLGHPSFIHQSDRYIEFSRYNIGVIVERSKFSLRGLVPIAWDRYLLAFSLLGIALISFFRRKDWIRAHPRLRVAVRSALMLIVLLTIEPFIANWIIHNAGAHYETAVTHAFDALWWIVLAYIVNRCINVFLWDTLERHTGNQIPTILRLFVAAIIFTLALFGIVGFVFDQKLTSLLATSGVIAMIIGLAIQINISNIFSGIALNIERPFKIGDWIKVHGRTPQPTASIIGQVIDIGWRTTRLRTTDNTIIVVSNTVIAEKTLTNFSAPDEISRFEQLFVVEHGQGIQRVLDVIADASKSVIGKENNGPLDEPPPKVRVSEVSPIGVTYLLRFYLLPREVSPAKARHAILMAVLTRLEEEGIKLARPILDFQADKAEEK